MHSSWADQCLGWGGMDDGGRCGTIRSLPGIPHRRHPRPEAAATRLRRGPQTGDEMSSMTDVAATPVVLKFPAYASAVGAARRGVIGILEGLVPAGHLDDVVMCTSELVTNGYQAAMRYALFGQFSYGGQETPIHVGVLACERWTRLDVRDPEPYMQPPAPLGLLAESGRGLGIVRALGGHLRHTLATDHKIVHAAIPVDGELTMAELAAAFPPGAQLNE